MIPVVRANNGINRWFVLWCYNGVAEVIGYLYLDSVGLYRSNIGIVCSFVISFDTSSGVVNGSQTIYGFPDTRGWI